MAKKSNVKVSSGGSTSRAEEIKQKYAALRKTTAAKKRRGKNTYRSVKKG